MTINTSSMNWNQQTTVTLITGRVNREGNGGMSINVMKMIQQKVGDPIPNTSIGERYGILTINNISSLESTCNPITGSASSDVTTITASW